MAIRWRWRYWLDFITVPIAAGWCLSSAHSLLAIVLGYVSWVLVEYGMHRWLFHVTMRRAHMIHHMRPHDHAGQVSSGQSSTALAVLFLTALALGFEAWMAGFLLGYLSYIVCHHLSHAERLQGTGWVRRHHLHHKGQPVNYNVLCPLGDLLFGTYRKA